MNEPVKNPAPQPKGPLDIEFWENCNNGVLCFQRCSKCQAWRHLPRYMCARCGSPEWAWEESAGRGKVYSWTVCHMAMAPVFADFVPYAVIMVEMEEGVRVISWLRDMDYRDLTLDLPVQARFEPLSNGGKLLFFAPAK